MSKVSKSKGQQPAKKTYKRPILKLLGSVKNLTLKTGSSVDGFGTFG